jgi:hypothetical protein
MFDTTSAGLLRLIEQGESETVEFKTFLPPDTHVQGVRLNRRLFSPRGEAS